MPCGRRGHPEAFSALSAEGRARERRTVRVAGHCEVDGAREERAFSGRGLGLQGASIGHDASVFRVAWLVSVATAT
ncbi:hypothetical protein B5V46_16435 [Rhodovulum sp. MB263]|nr:hypothetical protein B5V46_16435 [Rhodovulum sp. MB263]